MTLAERYLWAYGVAALVTTAVYVAWLAAQLADTPPADVAYVGPLLWTLLASFVVHTVGRAVAAGCRPDEPGRDERDREVDVRGNAAASCSTA